MRGYLSGSGWKDYRATGAVCGIPLPPGLRESERLPEPIFTPAAKMNTGGHDENISYAQVEEMIGAETAAELRRLTLEIYAKASAYARRKGLILADTKFEFGSIDGMGIVLADEVLTPDSSRYWPAAGIRARRAAAQLRQAICARLSGIDRMEQAGARARPARGCRVAYPTEIHGSVPPADGGNGELSRSQQQVGSPWTSRERTYEDRPTSSFDWLLILMSALLHGAGVPRGTGARDLRAAGIVGGFQFAGWYYTDVADWIDGVPVDGIAADRTHRGLSADRRLLLSVLLELAGRLRPETSCAASAWAGSIACSEWRSALRAAAWSGSPCADRRHRSAPQSGAADKVSIKSLFICRRA